MGRKKVDRIQSRIHDGARPSQTSAIPAESQKSLGVTNVPEKAFFSGFENFLGFFWGVLRGL